MKKCIKRIWADIKEYAGMGIVIVIGMLVMNLLFHTTCPSAIVLGLPCPGCGITRAAILLVTGHPIQAFQMNPSIYIWLFFFGYVGFYRYVRGKEPAHFNVVLVIVIAVVIGIFVAGMWKYFPDRAPYTVNIDNILARFLPIYGEFLEK